MYYRRVKDYSHRQKRDLHAMSHGAMFNTREKFARTTLESLWGPCCYEKSKEKYFQVFVMQAPLV